MAALAGLAAVATKSKAPLIAAKATVFFIMGTLLGSKSSSFHALWPTHEMGMNYLIRSDVHHTFALLAVFGIFLYYLQ